MRLAQIGRLVFRQIELDPLVANCEDELRVVHAEPQLDGMVRLPAIGVLDDVGAGLRDDQPEIVDVFVREAGGAGLLGEPVASARNLLHAAVDDQLRLHAHPLQSWCLMLAVASAAVEKISKTLLRRVSSRTVMTDGGTRARRTSPSPIRTRL